VDILQLWGLDLIRSIQQFHGPILDGLFRAITFLGTQEAYLLVLPFIMWCIDFRVGARLIIVLLVSSYLNTDLKDLFQQPRPFQLDPVVNSKETGATSFCYRHVARYHYPNCFNIDPPHSERRISASNSVRTYSRPGAGFTS